MSYKFEEFKKSSSSSASVWSKFLRDVNGQAAKCKTCNKIVKCAGGSTSTLHNHLRSMHNINICKRNAGENNGEPSNLPTTSTGAICSTINLPKTKITEYFSSQVDESLPAILSRMTASDGIPFSLFCTSRDLRMLLISKGFKDVPKSANTIRKLVIEYGQKICEQMKQEMRSLSANGFSLTFDEWTSLRNRRYLNINVHSDNDFWSLGLVRIWGGMPAENCIQLLNERLSKFGLSLMCDVVSIGTDAASVMQKIGRVLNVHQQLCFAHGIQLAVLDVLYAKPTNVISGSTDIDNELTSEDETHSENHFENDDNDDEDVEEYFSISNDEQTVKNISHTDVFPLTNKIHKTVKLFRRSPTKNDEILQKYVKMEFGGKELNLILDSKTRWSSLINMYERFYELRSCIQKSLIDLKMDSSNMFTENEFKVLEEIIGVLLPVKMAVEALCRRNANLLTADATFEFMFVNLSKCNTPFAQEFSSTLLNRIKQRRTQLSSLLQYLHNRYMVVEKNQNCDLTKNLYPKLKKAEIIKLIVSLIERINQNPNTDEDSTDDCAEVDQVIESSVDTEERSIPSTSSLKNEIQRTIDKHLLTPNPSTKTTIKTNLLTRIRREITIFEDEGVRGSYLESVYKSLLSVPATSVESERAFSSAGQICTKIRCRLSDESLNTLCTLRAFFKKQQKKEQ